MKYKELINHYKSMLNDEIELEGIEYIIEETNNLSRSELILSLDKEVLNEDKLISMLDKYCINHYPSQYIIGHTYFYGLKLKVNENVLIPRFDTEVLVEEVIKEINNRNKKLKVIDIGTGSGAIAIAIKKNTISAVEAVDISLDALEVAATNAENNNCSINFYISDLLSKSLNNYDIIVSNPPYIDIDDENEQVQNIVNSNEPHIALYSPEKGLNHYRRIIEESIEKINDDGVLFFEIPDNKCEAITAIAKKYYKDIKVIEDYHHLRRVLRIGDKLK